MQQLSSDRLPRVLAVIFLWCVLDWALFIPSYVWSHPHADFLPIFRASHGYDALSIGPLFVRRENLDVFRVSYDLLALLLLAIWTAPFQRARRPVRALGVTVYLVLLVFLFYHHAVGTFFARTPALSEDWRLALNLGHFLGSVMSIRWILTILMALLVPALLGFGFAFGMRELQGWAARWSVPLRLAVTALCVLPPAAQWARFGILSDEPTAQLLSKRIWKNLRASYFESIRLGEIRTGKPDYSYDAYSKLKLVRRPNAYLMMLEAYGEVLATSDMAPAYRALMKRVDARLQAAGYHIRTTYSEAPVHGGTSWFSISTVHTGMKVDRPTAYDALLLVGARLPSLTRFFNEQGYSTYALQPGNTDHKGLHRLDTFNHKLMIDAPRMRYRGKKWGWGQIPDQWSLQMLRSRYITRLPEPRYVFSMCVSTHWEWDNVPPFVRNWQALNDADATLEPLEDPSWPPIAEAAAIPSELRRNYFRSIEYEFRSLVEYFEAEQSPDIVVAILGDHQPRLESEVPGGITARTPLHILSRDAAYVDSFAAEGLTPGMLAAPRPPHPLRHEGLFSLFLSKLTAAYGAPDSPQVEFLPNGVGLSGLNR